ncbi:prolyl-tRNA editing enzyme YbaK/EbsC (Cys-tRNA(Pro) deacylase) [Peptoniphilus olsenii]|uniref:Prolyl-tRNA editing enzyme YbaK/EbsC (Cys-tRNA(Pro) deacylase) n=1 Tax=Peptoniphilus olsenii TaxID=411570 RepID=A0ABV2J965_9FIRM
MKKDFKTLIDISAKDRNYIYLSAGKVGLQMRIRPTDLAKILDISFVDITKE